MPAQQNYHSPEVDEIMGRIPGWIVRWGIAVIFAVFAGILVFSGFIAAPETIQGTIVLTTDNPPAQLVAGASGRFVLLHDPADSSVKEGAVIACIGSGSEYERVMQLETWLDDRKKRVAWPVVDGLPDELAGLYAACRVAGTTAGFELCREELTAGILAWTARHLVISPISGRLAVTAGQYVEEGEPVATVVPEGEAHVVGRMQVMAGYDGIRAGQVVWVRITGPGVDKDRKLQGVVNRVVPLAGTESDLVYVDFPDGIPGAMRELLQMHERQGTAEIVINDRSLLRKFIPLGASEL